MWKTPPAMAASSILEQCNRRANGSPWRSIRRTQEMTAPQNGKALELHSESSVGPLGPQMQRSHFPSAGSRFHGCDVDLQARTDLGFALPEHDSALPSSLVPHQRCRVQRDRLHDKYHRGCLPRMIRIPRIQVLCVENRRVDVPGRAHADQAFDRVVVGTRRRRITRSTANARAARTSMEKEGLRRPDSRRDKWDRLVSR